MDASFKRDIGVTSSFLDMIDWAVVFTVNVVGCDGNIASDWQ